MKKIKLKDKDKGEQGKLRKAIAEESGYPHPPSAVYGPPQPDYEDQVQGGMVLFGSTCEEASPVDTDDGADFEVYTNINEVLQALLDDHGSELKGSTRQAVQDAIDEPEEYKLTGRNNVGQMGSDQSQRVY